jgi:hypothetical protein
MIKGFEDKTLDVRPTVRMDDDTYHSSDRSERWGVAIVLQLRETMLKDKLRQDSGAKVCKQFDQRRPICQAPSTFRLWLTPAHRRAVHYA